MEGRRINKKKYCLIILYISLALALFAAGFLTKHLIFDRTLPKQDFSEKHIPGSYKYINPLLECDSQAFSLIKEIGEAKHDISDLIDDRIKKNKVSSVAVYYRDLNNGPWFGINEEYVFSPASLIKVPLMMAYYRLAESDPSVLEKEILVEQNYDYNVQNVTPEKELELGKRYKVEELIERMITYSDNYAYDVLLANIDNALVFQVYDDLGIDIREANTNNPNGNIINVREYSSFFRVLFNSSYLNINYSEKALDLLTKTVYQQGLTRDLPTDVAVAHKFGERTFLNLENENKQLHDCGIIYLANKPYLLCVMTTGDNITEMSDTIAEISKQVYNFVYLSLK
jgi:beta-lactamase class A